MNKSSQRTENVASVGATESHGHKQLNQLIGGEAVQGEDGWGGGMGCYSLVWAI